MIQGHLPEVLLSYKETPGAVETINIWIDKGYDVKIITGRPSGVYDASRQWLNEHGRENFIKGSTFGLELEDYYKMHFDYAVEDSSLAFKFFNHLPDLKVMVFDRPWNKDCELPGPNYKRCFDWKMIREIVG